MVHKGSNPHVDSYSAFFDNQKLSKTCLEELIRQDVFLQCIAMTDVMVFIILINDDSDDGDYD